MTAAKMNNPAFRLRNNGRPRPDKNYAFSNGYRVDSLRHLG